MVQMESIQRASQNKKNPNMDSFTDSVVAQADSGVCTNEPLYLRKGQQ